MTFDINAKTKICVKNEAVDLKHKMAPKWALGMSYISVTSPFHVKDIIRDQKN